MMAHIPPWVLVTSRYKVASIACHLASNTMMYTWNYLGGTRPRRPVAFSVIGFTVPPLSVFEDTDNLRDLINASS